MDLVALIIASFTFPAVFGAVLLGAVGYHLWGWVGAVVGAIPAVSPRHVVRAALCRRAAVAVRQGLGVAGHVHRRAGGARHCHAMTG